MKIFLSAVARLSISTSSDWLKASEKISQLVGRFSESLRWIHFTSKGLKRPSTPSRPSHRKLFTAAISYQVRKILISWSHFKNFQNWFHFDRCRPARLARLWNQQVGRADRQADGELRHFLQAAFAWRNTLDPRLARRSPSVWHGSDVDGAERCTRQRNHSDEHTARPLLELGNFEVEHFRWIGQRATDWIWVYPWWHHQRFTLCGPSRIDRRQSGEDKRSYSRERCRSRECFPQSISIHRFGFWNHSERDSALKIEKNRDVNCFYGCFIVIKFLKEWFIIRERSFIS